MRTRTSDGRFAPTPKQVRTNIYLTQEQHHAAQSEALRAGKTMAEVIRDWIEKGRKS